MVVLPLPLWPTMTVTGVKNSMTEMFLSSKERIPRIASLFRLAMAGSKIGEEFKLVDETSDVDEMKTRAISTRREAPNDGLMIAFSYCVTERCLTGITTVTTEISIADARYCLQYNPSSTRVLPLAPVLSCPSL